MSMSTIGLIVMVAGVIWMVISADQKKKEQVGPVIKPETDPKVPAIPAVSKSRSTALVEIESLLSYFSEVGCSEGVKAMQAAAAAALTVKPVQPAEAPK